MSVATIEVRFPDKFLKPDDVEERRVLTTLEVIYEGGSLHGKTADFPTRDPSQVVVGLRQPDHARQPGPILQQPAGPRRCHIVVVEPPRSRTEG